MLVRFHFGGTIREVKVCADWGSEVFGFVLAEEFNLVQSVVLTANCEKESSLSLFKIRSEFDLHSKKDPSFAFFIECTFYCCVIF